MNIPLSPSVSKVIGLLLLAATAMAFSSCHATSGLGRDIRHVGQKIENTADRIH